jgi:hypothetical protein
MFKYLEEKIKISVNENRLITSYSPFSDGTYEKAALHYIYKKLGFNSYLPFSESLKRMTDEATFRASIDGAGRSQPAEKSNSNKQRPLHLRHYKTGAWTQFTVPGPDTSVNAAFNANSELGSDATMCVIPTQLGPVNDPAAMKKANVRSEWLDRLVSHGCSVLLVHGKWFDNLTETAEMVAAGYDPFTRVEQRINTAVDYCIENGHASPGRVLAIGSSRYGFAILHSMAKNKNISGAVAHQPIVWWPNMREFSEIHYSNPILKDNSLYEMGNDLPPRPLLIQTGYMDDRIGPYAMEKLVNTLRECYDSANASKKFTHEPMEVPGHSGRVPDTALDSLPQWLKRQGSELFHGA